MKGHTRAGSRHEKNRERTELVRALSRRFVELRREAGMRQQDVAEAMARERSGSRFVRRLEHGGAASAALRSVADYLRAVRAGFGSLKPALDRYTSMPIPREVRRLAEAAARPRVPAAPAALTWTGNRPALPAALAELIPAGGLLRVRRRAGYWMLRRFLELYLHNVFDALGAPGWHWLRRRMARYGRRVFAMLFFTRGPKEKTRAERWERLRKAADRLQLTRELAAFVEAVVTRLFEDMQAENELDWLPDPADAIEIMARKPARRLVTDAQMCLAEWDKVNKVYARAVSKVEKRGHEAADRLLAAECRDPSLVRRYGTLTVWATRIAADTMAGTPAREKSLRNFAAWRFPPRLDRGLIDRLLATVLEVWDSSRPTLPPHPGPMPQ